EADIRTGGSAAERYGVFIDSEGDLTATGNDAAIGVAALSDAAAFKNLILIRPTPAKPLQTSGSLLTSTAAFTVANAFDLSRATISGNLLKVGGTSSAPERALWLGSNGFLNLGNAATPDNLLTINGNTVAAAVAPLSGSQLHVMGADGALARM